MIISQRMGLLVFLSVLALAACSKREDQFKALVPPGATSVSYIHQSDVSEGVTFHVQSEPKSYRYIDAIRKKVSASGYVLCKKSALNEWAEKPVEAGSARHKGFWLVELYAMKDYSKFFMVRVDGTPINDGANWRQGFLLAAQTVPQGRQDMESIKKFCD
jgi:hypothetical protein